MLFALTAIVLMVVLALATALGTILWAGHKSLEKQRDFIQAFYFAETSLEYSLLLDDHQPTGFAGRVGRLNGNFSAVIEGHNGSLYAIKAVGIRQGVSDTVWTVIEKKDEQGSSTANYRLRSWKEKSCAD